MVDVPVLLAFTGGLVATVNPCGFAMLPAYLSFFLGIEDATQRVDRAAAVARALWVGVVVSAGFVTVFGVAGLLLSTGARVLTSALPWAALMVGAAVIGLGGWLLTGRGLRTMVPAPGRAVQGRSPGAVFMFGVAYAVASLSCTLPVFLAVVAGTATNLGAMSTLIVFGVYAAGMTLPLLALTVGLAFGRDALVRRTRTVGRHADRIAGGMLVVAGVYVVAFWVAELTGTTAGPLSAVIVAVERGSSRLTNLIGSDPLLWATVFAAIVIAAAVGAFRARGRDRSASRTPLADPRER